MSDDDETWFGLGRAWDSCPGATATKVRRWRWSTHLNQTVGRFDVLSSSLLPSSFFLLLSFFYIPFDTLEQGLSDLC